ncbi:TRAG family protein, partial [Acidithiobacillus sp. GGI-221]
TASHTQRQYSGNRLQVLLQHVNTNEQVIQRPLLTPEEFMRLPATDEVVFVSGHAPIYCRKIVYYTDPVLNRRRAIPPPTLSFPGGPASVNTGVSAVNGDVGGTRIAAGGQGQKEEEDPRAVIADFIEVASAPVSAPENSSAVAQSQTPPLATRQPRAPETTTEDGDDEQPF